MDLVRHSLSKLSFFSLLVKAKEKSSDSQWLKSVVSSGTLNDKVAALTVQIQVSFKNFLCLLRYIFDKNSEAFCRCNRIQVGLSKVAHYW